MDITSGAAPRRLWLLVGGLALFALGAARAVAVPRSAPEHPVAVTVSVGTNAVGTRIGAHFLGLSFEASTLPRLARDRARGNLVGLLRSLGPGVIRFGGISVDLATTFARHPRRGPPRARRANASVEAGVATVPIDFLHPTAITPGDFDRLGALLRAVGWTALVAVPLGHYNPAAAAREAAAASRGLRRTLLAIEIGNEPDGYPLIGLRPSSWSYPQYLAQVLAYKRAILAAAPSIRIAGPDTTQNASVEWLTAFAQDVRPAILTPHFYALTACGGAPPTLDALLSSTLATRDGHTLTTLGMISQVAHVQVRLGETNNIGCQGQPGVSNTYGSALWAVRHILDAARAGIVGVNFHTLPESCYGRYSPICAPTPAAYAAGRFRVMPEWYALLLVRQLVGERLLSTVVAGDHPGLTVDAVASRSRRQLDFVIVNTSATPATSYSVDLRSPEAHSAAALWLTAPALDATTGVKLGGGQVGRSGTWRPRLPLRAVLRAGHTFQVTVPPGSAVLVRLSSGPRPVPFAPSRR